MSSPTPETWVDVFLAGDRDYRLGMASMAIDAQQVSSACWMGAHEDRIAHAESQRAAFGDVVRELQTAVAEMSDAARPGVSLALRRLGATLDINVEPTE